MPSEDAGPTLADIEWRPASGMGRRRTIGIERRPTSGTERARRHRHGGAASG